MTSSIETTSVIFRKFKDHQDIIALFPYEVETYAGAISCYMHIGQHSTADYQMCIRASTPAAPSEYQRLKNELISIGYSLRIIQKRRLSKYLAAWTKIYKQTNNI